MCRVPKKLKCDKHVPCSSCVRRGCDNICPTGTLRSVGRGKRAVMHDIPELHSTIAEMGQRIRDLENAIASTQKKSVNAQPWSFPASSAMDLTPTPCGDPLGSFILNEDREPVYFGPVGGVEVLRSYYSASKIATAGRDSLLFGALTLSFPFSPFSSRVWDPIPCLDRLAVFLPSPTRARHLCATYFRNAVWHGTPVTQPALLDLFNLIYTRTDSTPPPTAPQLSILFLVFAIGSIVDLDIPELDNPDGDCYFGLANAALSIRNVFDEEPVVETVQALVLLANYYTYGSRRYSLEAAWQMISMASSLAQRLGLHSEKHVSKFPAPIANRYRGLFWELYTCENQYGLAVGRPVSIQLHSITCAFPRDDEGEEGDQEPFVKTLPGYRHARWTFVQDIMTPVLDQLLATKKPSYETILNLDLKIRKFMQIRIVPLEAMEVLEGDPPVIFLQRGMLRVWANQVLLFIHRDCFIEAMRTSPSNPLQSPYASSFLAAYRSAAEMVRINEANCRKFPDLLPRWSGTWKSVVESAIIVGTVAIRYPDNNPCEVDFSKANFMRVMGEMLATADLLDKASAGSCGPTNAGFGILRSAIEKALALHSRHHPEPHNTSGTAEIQTQALRFETIDRLRFPGLLPERLGGEVDTKRDMACVLEDEAGDDVALVSSATATSSFKQGEAGSAVGNGGLAVDDIDNPEFNLNSNFPTHALWDHQPVSSGGLSRDEYTDELIAVMPELGSLMTLASYSDGMETGVGAGIGADAVDSQEARFWEQFLNNL
ncbi:Zn(2)-C6 fungal-type domain-containing protein [Favolaschia claudopus]|uniref:Zn(2)-C6 fungal-type domain-containing protein n=1 Tax=Favolaschia claudopus TaxID=2862362 RepID=A0AAW0E7V1_9AGAR